MEYYSAVEKDEILPLAAMWMDLENIMLTEVSQKEKDKCYIILLKCKKNTNECTVYTKWTHKHQCVENKSVVTKGERDRSKGTN